VKSEIVNQSRFLGKKEKKIDLKLQDEIKTIDNVWIR
jgi:hypothetical protein